MTIVRYEPWRLVHRLNHDLNQLFGTGVAAPEASTSNNVAWIPSVDIHEEAERFVVRADIPGVDPKDVEITAEKGVLTLRGTRQSEKKQDGDNGYGRVERVSGAFLRRFTLPENAQTDAIKAKQVNGVLEVTIPKQPEIQPKRISVEAA